MRYEGEIKGKAKQAKGKTHVKSGFPVVGQFDRYESAS